MDINEKLANLTTEQSKALAEAMNAAYNKQPVTDSANDEKKDEPDKDDK